jgi:nucleoside-diphosphate-sugar epimerase
VKALVTGASGFLGQRIVSHLRARGVQVRAMVRRGKVAGSAEETVEADLCDTAALERVVDGVDWVLHAGARVRTHGSWEEFESANVRATGELIRASVAAGVQRLVHVSSLSVYAVPSDGAVVGEDSPLETAGSERGHYARSKLAADLIAQQWIQRGAPVTVVRPGLLYGPGRRPPLARRAVALGPLRVIFARKGYLLPLAHVDNVAEAIFLAAASAQAVGRSYTLVDHPVRQEDYVSLYRNITGAGWRPIYFPVRWAVTAAGIAEAVARPLGIRPPIGRHQVERTVRSANFPSVRAEKELAWRPAISLADGLRSSLAAS